MNFQFSHDQLGLARSRGAGRAPVLAALLLLFVLQGCSAVGFGGSDSEGVFASGKPRTVWTNRKLRGGSQVIGRVIPPTETPGDFPVIEIPNNPQVKSMMAALTGNERRCLEQRLVRGRSLVLEIQPILRQYGVPDEFVNLAMLESAFNPKAISPSGAVGLWQFTKSTARNYGLVVNQKVDERKDPLKSTHAAAKHLVDLFDIYGAWYLALAAYNAGVGRVNKAIQIAGTTDFFEIAERGLLAKETQDFVPRFLALTTISRAPETYGFDSIYKLASN